MEVFIMRDPFTLDTTSQVKLHINLPEIAWDIIMDDISSLSEGNIVNGKSNFVNYLVNHYIENKLYPTNFDNELKSITNRVNDLNSLFTKIDKTTKSKSGNKASTFKTLSNEHLKQHILASLLKKPQICLTIIKKAKLAK